VRVEREQKEEEEKLEEGTEKKVTGTQKGKQLFLKPSWGKENNAEKRSDGMETSQEQTRRRKKKVHLRQTPNQPILTLCLACPFSRDRKKEEGEKRDSQGSTERTMGSYY